MADKTKLATWLHKTVLVMLTKTATEYINYLTVILNPSIYSVMNISTAVQTIVSVTKLMMSNKRIKTHKRIKQTWNSTTLTTLLTSIEA